MALISRTTLSVLEGYFSCIKWL